jgi:hypothetical protein
VASGCVLCRWSFPLNGDPSAAVNLVCRTMLEFRLQPADVVMLEFRL